MTNPDIEKIESALEEASAALKPTAQEVSEEVDRVIVGNGVTASHSEKLALWKFLAAQEELRFAARESLVAHRRKVYQRLRVDLSTAMLIDRERQRENMKEK